MNDSCFFTLPEVEVGVVLCVERLKDGNIHMCLFSRSGLQFRLDQLCNQKQYLG